MPITSSDRNLPDWLTRVRTGQTKLPRFQRWEAWGHGNVTALFNTILQDLPAGSVLILQVGDKEPFPSRLIEGVKVGAEKVTEHLLDGQQRLTALWRGLNNNYDERTYFLHLSKDEETGMPYFIDSVPRRRRKSDDLRVPLWADDPASQWQRRMIPLDVLAPTPESNSAYMKWASEAIEDVHEQLEILNIAYEVRGNLRPSTCPTWLFPRRRSPIQLSRCSSGPIPPPNRWETTISWWRWLRPVRVNRCMNSSLKSSKPALRPVDITHRRIWHLQLQRYYNGEWRANPPTYLMGSPND